MAADELPTGDASWNGIRVGVLGASADAFAAADNLAFLGADVVVHVGEDELASLPAEFGLLQTLGVTVTAAPAAFEDYRLLVEHPDDFEALAWRLRPAGVPWLVAAGRSAVDIAVRAGHMALEAGLHPTVAGGGLRPLVEAVRDPDTRDVVIAVVSGEVDLSPESAVLLGGAAPVMVHETRVFQNVERACVYNKANAAAIALVQAADVVEGARAIGVTLETPAVGMLGLVDDLLVDRAFVEDRQTSAAELGTIADLEQGLGRATTDEDVLVALAAAALMRAHGLSQAAVRDGLRRAVDAS